MSNIDHRVLMKDALQKIKHLQTQLETVTQKQTEPIAIIGLACRFPGQSNTPEQFWQMLARGVDAVRPMPAARRAFPEHADALPPCYGGFLERIDTFDPAFFRISPREARMMDPQQRLLLETSWEALEAAALAPDSLFNSLTGVFIGLCNFEYAVLMSHQSNLSPEDELHVMTGLSMSAAAGRVAYTFGFTGPAVVIDTACSSSLVAIHQACQSLRHQECHLALAGGVNLLVNDFGVADGAGAENRMHALDGRCKTFDAAANGFGRGEGCGVVVLKRLSDAQADGDPILAIVRGSMVNQDGRSSGFSAPSGPSQQTVIRQALQKAGVDPQQVGYIEAHGTGTTLGDPIEIGAINAVFRKRTEPLWVGSVKTNFGHLEGAAGIAGVIKTVLALQHGQIPPHLHFQTPNPYIDWEGSPVQIPTSLTPWPPTGPDHNRRIAGISSFGISGTNAHIIVEGAPRLVSPNEETAPAHNEAAWHLLTLSAKSEEALAALVESYRHFLATPAGNRPLADLCYTSHVGRSHFAYRLTVPASSLAELQTLLDRYSQAPAEVNLPQGQLTSGQKAPSIAFLFTGQGAQYVDMGRALYTTNAVFRMALDRCEALYQEYTGKSLLAVLYPETGDWRLETRDTRAVGTSETQDNGTSLQSPASSLINDTTYTQPALFALEVALAQVWQSWGIRPQVLIGHSVGELAAACVAGVFSLDDGMKLVAARGRLMGALPHDGAMVAILADEATVQRAIAPYADSVAIAAVNGPTNIVISGQRDAVNAIAATLTAAAGDNAIQNQKSKIKNLTVSHAFHSPLMDPMLDAFRQVAASITYHAPQVPLVSNLTGQLAGAEVTTPDYWVRHVRQAVRFGDGITTVQAMGIEIWLEIGPKPVLLGMAQANYELRAQGAPANYELHAQGAPANDEKNVTDGRLVTRGGPLGAKLVTLPSLREHQPDGQQMLTSLGALYVRGAAIDWAALDQATGATGTRRKVTLPTYPFQHQRYWVDATPPATAQAEDPDGFAQWFLSKDVEQLTDLITDRGAFAAQERATVTKVLTTLAAERRAQQRADEVAALIYEVRWERQPRSRSRVPAATPGRWLILADTQGVGQALATQLLTLGEQVELVATPSALAEVTAQWATADTAGSPQPAPLRGVIHLWSLDDGLPADLTALLASQERNLGSVLHLVCTAAAAFSQTAPRLWIATSGAQSLALTEPVAVTQAPLWGMGRVITLEHSELWGGLVDLDRAATLAEKAQALLAEIWPTASSEPQEEGAGEEQVAYRQDNRYVARLVPAQLAPAATPVTIRPDGLYLVTGGLGGLGLQTVQWLAAAGARHLLVTGRRGLQTPQQEATVAALQAQGVTVTVAPVDVADESAMRALFEQIASGPAPLRGVIHAAGVGGFTPLRSLQWADFVTMLQPKVLGGWLLHCLTAAHDLDFFVSYASGAGIWGGKQQAHYAAANHFLDGLMAYRRSQGLPGLSIAWGPWAGAGMASPEAQALFRAMGVQALAPETGLAIQAHLLQTTACQVTAASIDWARLKPLYELTKPRRFLAQIQGTQRQAEDEQQHATTKATAAPPPVIEELQALAVARRFEHLRGYVQRTAGRVLGMPALPDPTVGFADLGMDSLMALEVKRQLEQGLQQPLAATIALEYPTVDTLTTYLLDLLLLGAQESAPATGVTTHHAPPATLTPHQSAEPIAIVSMACRFPGADTPEAFWQVLQAGVDMVREVPTERWPVADFYAMPRPTPGKMYTREAAFIENVAHFDPLFFGIAPREATGIDPQQRLLLEVSWEALERAGLAQSTLVDSATGVFIGIGRGDYEDATGGIQSVADLDTHVITSGGNSVAAGRLAYTFGLQGPTIAVDTACSSSLVALHLACQSLRTGECDLALAGGVNLILAPFTHIALSQMGALAVDGRCKSFDAAADGFGRGEGCGVVLLKRLSDAQRDGDTILAVVKGSAVNHDGPSSGLTVPNKRAQEKLLRQALRNAGVTADEVAYIEAHGTGTALGDPIEIRALGAVFGAARATPLLVGSVKSNVAHLEAAAGIAGIIKTVLALHHGQIPPHLHFTTPNPYIEWDEVAIAVPTTLQPWPPTAPGQPVVAGVSAFGISGTNAHIVLARAEWETGDRETGDRKTGDRKTEDRKTERGCYLLPLSAKNPAALPALAARYGEQLRLHPEIALADLCYTAAIGRNHFAHRLALVAADREELQTQLAAVSGATNPLEGAEDNPDQSVGMVAQGAPRLAFLFTGQGSQYVQMGRQFYETEPRFRAILERCEAVAQQSLGRSLLDLLYPATAPTHNDLLESHPCGQAANFAIQCALVEVWQAWGIQPDLVLGHSLGDFAAAYTAGVLSLEDGLRLVSERGRLMEQAVGSMVAVMGSEADVAPFVAPYADVVIGVINGPRSVVISGGHAHVQEATTALEAAGFKTRKVAVPMAAHSPLLDPVLDAFERFIRQQITLHPPQRPVVSSMTGALVTDELTDPTYWRQHLRNTVRFADGVTTLATEGMTLFIEIGPKPTLLGMVEPILDKMTESRPHPLTPSPPHPLTLASLHQNEDDWRQMMRNLGQLYVHGVKLDWLGGDGAGQRRKVLLPTYPFQRERYWIDAPKRKATATLRPLIDKLTVLPLHHEIVGEREFSLASLPFLADHRLYGTVVAPGACQLAMALSAAELTLGQQRPATLTLEDIILPQPLVIPEEQARTVQAILTESKTANGSGPHYEFKIVSFDLTADVVEPLTHATGTLFAVAANRAEAPADLAALRERCEQALDITAFYATAAEGGLRLGPTFQWVDSVWRGQQGATVETVGKLTLPTALGATTGYLLHPGLLDACFQVAGLAQDEAAQENMLLPFALTRLQLYQPMIGTQWWCHAIQRAATSDPQQKKWDISLWDEQGAPVALLEGFTLRAASAESVQSADRWRDWLYQITWQPRPYFGLAPDYLATPAQLAASLRQQTAVPPAPDETAVQALHRALETVSIAYVVAAFGKAGFLFQPGAEWRTEQIAQKLGVIPSYRRLLERLLGMLAEAGILRRQADGWQVVQTPVTDPPVQTMQTLQTTYGAPSELRLLARCGAALHEVLLGVQEPLELLFPEGDATTATEQHTAAAGAVAMNGLLHQVVQDAVAHLPAERGIRIVEIGAGTGGTTAGLLPRLSPERTEYLFTDIGPTFLQQARARFADYPFVRYQPLDIERAPVAQGFAPQQADLVIAANVLHATRDLAETLAHVRQLLQPGGQLLLLEATMPSRWVDLTFGLTSGWWRFADQRQDHPLLTAAQWQALLLEQGFQAVETIEQGGQAVIIAQTATSTGSVTVEGTAQPLASTSSANTSSANGEVWLLFADTQGIAAAMATQLRQQGAIPRLVYPGERYQQVDTHTFVIDAERAEDYQRLLTACATVANRPPRGIIHSWSVDGKALGHITDLTAAAQHSYGTALHLVQAVLAQQLEVAGLWLVTRDAQAVSVGDSVTGVIQSGLWGMGRTIALEHPELHCVRLDLDGTMAPAQQAATLWAEIAASAYTEQQSEQPVEEQVALRRDARYVARLARYAPSPGLALPAGPYRLAISERGGLDNLQLQPTTRRSPAAGEVEIRVQASGLNFLDVLDVLGILPFDRALLGGECAGEIVQVGAGVTAFQVGDRVAALVAGAFSQYVTVLSDLVVTLPPALTFEQAAGIPSNFLTAHYALHTVANIQPGDKVLIHAAAGGTGMAAIQLAQAAGAEIYATASPGKWPTLRALGITHLYNSRTLAFAEQILTDTGGQGVNVVLNSLTGEGFMAKNLAVLAPGGRFLELAKRDIWQADAVHSSRADIHYHFIDLMTVAQEQPALIGTLLATLIARFATGALHLLPQTAFAIQEAVAAFRYMQQAKHIGKIVLTVPATESSALKPTATYLITGGLGGLGLAVAEWLVEQGARHLLLLGRSAPNAEAQQQLERLTALGVTVTVIQADVTDRAQLENALQQVDSRYPLCGVIHSVGVLDDGLLVQQSWARFAKVLAPKIQGSWHLHELTKTLPLEFFVLFSSMTGLLGNRGQANHAAANAFLDAFVHYRRAHGLPALSINWGGWSEIGAAADLVRENRQFMAARGQGAIDPTQGLAAFAYLLAQNQEQRAVQVGVMPIQWPQFLAHTATNLFYRDFQQADLTTSPLVATAPVINLRHQLSAADADTRNQLLIDYLRSAVAKVLGLRDPAQIHPHQGLLEMGLDSLMAIELRNQMGRALDQKLPSTLIFDYPTIDELRHYLLRTLFVETTAQAAGEVGTPVIPPGASTTPLVADEIGELSVDELMAQIAADFKAFQ